MDLHEFKKEFIREQLGIDESYGSIFSFIDFGNVNNWFREDRQTADNKPLDENQILEIHLEGLKEFSDVFSNKTRIYYGHDPRNQGSSKFIDAFRIVFGKRRVVTKDIQYIKHYIDDSEQATLFKTDKDGEKYIEIPKCNFDVEIAVDAIKMLEHYDTFCLFSGDADFVYLNNYLKRKSKKIVLIKAGHITRKLKGSADLVVNAQRVKQYITRIKEQRPD